MTGTGLRALFLASLLGGPATVGAQLPRSISDSAFAALVARFSEPSGYFDTDNLISNEDSYLHPITTLAKNNVSGGVYIGVGPDQNFSYIAAIRPRAAVIIDIRRDNLLEHLMFKAIFARSRNRAEYLSMLFGKQAPRDTAGWGARSVDSIIAYVQRAPASISAASIVSAEAAATGVVLFQAEIATIRRFHAAFAAEGPALRFTSHGRAPAAGYPDFADLARARDRAGQQRGFLASEDAFRVVKDLQDRNLVIPAVGNFGGDRAFVAVGAWMRETNERLSALYASNVEQYLWRDGLFEAFYRNIVALPRMQHAVIIRSCFNFCRFGHEQAVNGFYSVQMLQRIDSLVAVRGRLRSYGDLVTVGLLPP